MQIQAKVVIVMIILVLSLGPLTYFFNVNSQQQLNIPPPGQNDTGPIVRTLAANVTGQIISVKPYISYVGLSTSNNEAYVRGILEGLGYRNYTLSTTLNPQGQGYVYRMKIFFGNVSEAKEIGFRIYFRLNPFFYAQNIPILEGSVLLPDRIDTSNAPIFVQPNTSISAILLYREVPGTFVTVECSDIITSMNYNFTRSGMSCIDQMSTIRYGLTLSDMGENSAEFAENEKVTVDSIKSIDFNVSYSMDISDENISTALKAVNAQFIPIISLGVRGGIVYSNDTSDASALNIRDFLASFDITITGEYKVGDITMPATKILSGNTYELFAFPKAYVALKFSDKPGEINARITYTAIFSEITEIQVEKL
jgi:hypothetical protein